MFNKGSEVTSAKLTTYFKELYRSVNELSNRNLSQMTSGQFMSDMVSNGERTIFEPLNVYSTQYFSTHLLAYGDNVMDMTRWYTTQYNKILGD